nr:MAG TPA: hypothetical protein [Caudoviricetes sp.]
MIIRAIQFDLFLLDLIPSNALWHFNQFISFR